jgi:hypothetical protein
MGAHGGTRPWPPRVRAGSVTRQLRARKGRARPLPRAHEGTLNQHVPNCHRFPSSSHPHAHAWMLTHMIPALNVVDVVRPPTAAVASTRTSQASASTDTCSSHPTTTASVEHGDLERCEWTAVFDVAHGLVHGEQVLALTRLDRDVRRGRSFSACY